MMPLFGTTIMDMVMENYSDDLEAAIEDELRRVIGNEPRLELNELNIRFQDHLIEVEISVTYVPGSIAETLFIEFDRKSESVT